MLSPNDIEKRLHDNFPDADIEVQDLTGGGDHWDVKIKSPAFQGKSLVEQHQMVYRSLGTWMKKEIHALKLHTSEN
jgi:stress-induced morphogen